jgi:hypothetical protein
MAQTTESTPLLENFNQIDDMVGFNQTQCYRYYVYADNTDV